MQHYNVMEHISWKIVEEYIYYIKIQSELACYFSATQIKMMKHIFLEKRD